MTGFNLINYVTVLGNEISSVKEYFMFFAGCLKNSQTMRIMFRGAMLMSFEIECSKIDWLYSQSPCPIIISVFHMSQIWRCVAQRVILNAVGVFRAASKIIRSGRVFDKLHRDAINPHGFQLRTFVEQIVVVKCLTIKRENERDICE